LVRTLLAELVPSRLAERLCALHLDGGNLTLAQLGDKALDTFCRHLHAWQIAPASTVGYRKAEVTRGGVDTTELSSRTMESQKVPGLYFIGEVVDVTGWLGGYNFQWAWSSGWAAAQAL
jgi:predicted flavoprotein YhiN